jgi:hypothetical protein
MFDQRVLRVAVFVCVIGLGDTESKAWQFAGVESFAPSQLPPVVAEPERQIVGKFMVWSGAYWLLGPDGEEKECVHSITGGKASISPDERWVAYGAYTSGSPDDKRQGWLVIQSRVNPEARKSVPLNWESPMSRAVPLWSSDSKRILIREQAGIDDRPEGSLYVIDLLTKKRTVIDKPGHTGSYCWSSEGSKVAYAWQMPLRQAEEVVERKAYLITCDLDGGTERPSRCGNTPSRRIARSEGLSSPFSRSWPGGGEQPMPDGIHPGVSAS